MSFEQKPILRCAIYTRKSSEEGLEQSFNSLDAQREACEAFILSQRQEGWRVLANRYDDGGYSGGNIDRPGLKRLLEDVQAKKVNVIVVYKVDRLTRSLADFAKIVEALDARGVSFVSVTQQFNTTSSMGRLTLNVLLSFAQFEREVTGERIRDKIAASKKKGMWMGGRLPLGYDLKDRKLVPNNKEAAVVRAIFSRYVELGCVFKLKTQLDRDGIKSKLRTNRTGKRCGGVAFYRGALYHLLRNRLYIGEVRHRNQWYPGEHEGLVPKELWDRVQEQLSANLKTRRFRATEQGSSLLTGLLEDAFGRYTPSFTIKNGRRYRYYVSQRAIKNPGVKRNGSTRLPALEVERLVAERLQAFLKSDAEVFDGLSRLGESPDSIHGLVAQAKKLASRWPGLLTNEVRTLLMSFVEGITVGENSVQVKIRTDSLRQILTRREGDAPPERENLRRPDEPQDLMCLSIEAKLKRYGGEVHVVVPPNSLGIESTRNPRPSLIKAMARAYGWHQRVLEGKAIDQKSLAQPTGLTTRYVRKVFRFAFLAPDIVEAILEGRQPLELTFAKLYRHIPLNWVEQRSLFGFPAVSAQQ